MNERTGKFAIDGADGGMAAPLKRLVLRTVAYAPASCASRSTRTDCDGRGFEFGS